LILKISLIIFTIIFLSDKEIIFRQEFTLEELEKKYPVKFMNSHKKMIYEMLPPLTPEILAEKVSVTKWNCKNYPANIPSDHQIAHKMFEDAFPYP
jgi:hypothetical protein